MRPESVAEPHHGRRVDPTPTIRAAGLRSDHQGADPADLPASRRDADAPTENVASFAEQEPAAINLTGAQTPNGQIDLLGGVIEEPTRVAAAPVRLPAIRAARAAYVQLSSSPSEADAAGLAPLAQHPLRLPVRRQ